MAHVAPDPATEPEQPNDEGLIELKFTDRPNWIMDLLYQLMVGYQGTNHLMCLFTPLTGGTLLSAHAKVKASAKLTDLWMLIFNLHKGLDAGTHLLNFVHWFPRLGGSYTESDGGVRRFVGMLALVVTHFVSFIFHVYRYTLKPLALEKVRFMGLKVDFYADCISQVVSMFLVLGSHNSFRACFGQWLFKEWLYKSYRLDLTAVRDSSPHHLSKWK